MTSCSQTCEQRWVPEILAVVDKLPLLASVN